MHFNYFIHLILEKIKNPNTDEAFLNDTNYIFNINKLYSVVSKTGSKTLRSYGESNNVLFSLRLSTPRPIGKREQKEGFRYTGSLITSEVRRSFKQTSLKYESE